MRGVLRAIALNTFREAVRDRVLYLFLVFALVVIGAARFLSLLTVGDEDKIIKDLGLSAMSLFGVMTAVFVGVSLVFKEIERRTVYTLLANPVRRWQFVVGKYAGLLAVLGANLVLMAVALAALLAIRGEDPGRLVAAEALVFLRLALVTAFAILFSCLTKPILAALATTAVYVVGSVSWSFDLLRARMPTPAGKMLCDVLHVIVPNLDRLDIRAQAVHGAALPPGYVGSAVAYGLCYTAVVIAAACLVFERREFQ